MSTATQVTSTVANAESSAIITGTIIRISAANAGRCALADSPANVVGLIGPAMVGGGPGVSFPVALLGDATVLMEPGLTLAVDEPIYVSATVAGRATNVAPSANARFLGVIKSTAGYAGSQTVLAVVTAVGAPSSSSTAPATLKQTLTNGEGSTIVLGEIVAVQGTNNSVGKALALTDFLDGGTIGVVADASIANGAAGAVAVAGEALVRMEAGLTLTAGTKIFISKTVAGRGTNQIPDTTVIPIGVILDTSPYAGTGRVLATITGIDFRPSSSGGGGHAQGADIAAAGTISPAVGFDTFLVTGPGTISTISTTGRVNGDELTLILFEGQAITMDVAGNILPVQDTGQRSNSVTNDWFGDPLTTMVRFKLAKIHPSINVQRWLQMGQRTQVTLP